MKKVMVLSLAFLFVMTPVMLAADQSPAWKWARVQGEITSINSVDKQIVVDGVTVQVTSFTVIMMLQVPISFDDLVVGMVVRAVGVMDNGVLLARKINVKCDDPLLTRIEGQIDSINSTDLQVVVGTITVQVTVDTVILMKDVVLTFDDLKVGMTIAACGTLDNSVLTADKINVKYGGN